MTVKLMFEGPGTKLVGPNLAMPTQQGNGKPKYSTGIVTNKTNVSLANAILEATKKVAEEASRTNWGGRKPANASACLRDGDLDRKDNTFFHGKFFVNASTTKEPVLLTANGNNADPRCFETGTPVKAEICFYPYNYMGRIGVAVGLERLWLDDAPEQSSVPLDEDDF